MRLNDILARKNRNDYSLGMVQPIDSSSGQYSRSPRKKKASKLSETDSRVKKTGESFLKASLKAAAKQAYINAERASVLARQKAQAAQRAALKAQKAAFQTQRAHMAQQSAAVRSLRAAQKAKKEANKATKKASKLRKILKV